MNMNDEPFSHRADVPEDVRRSVRHVVAGGSESEGVVEADDFHEYENLERLGLREGTLAIGARAFQGCTKLRRVDDLPSLRCIGWGAFLGCSSLSEMNLPEGLQSIVLGAFWGHRFRQITIPSSVREIGIGAFSNGKVLSEVTLAGGTVLVCRYAFRGCRQLRSIAVPPVVIVVEEGGYGNGRAEVVTGGRIAGGGREPTRLILTSPYLASMPSADVKRARRAVNRIAGAGGIRSRLRGLLSAIHRVAGGRPRAEGPLDLAAGDDYDWIRVCRGADRIRLRFLGLLSAHRRALASTLERSPLWESEGGGVEPGVIEIILSFLGEVEG